MKKMRQITALFLSALLLAGCGGQKDSGESTWRGIQAGMEDLSAITDRTEYYDIVTEQEPIFQWEQEKEDSPLSIERAELIGMQFYQGEPVQLWQVPSLIGMRMTSDICLYRSDGSREVLLPGVDTQYKYYGYLDQEGKLYWWHNSTVREYWDGRTEQFGTSLKKYDSPGELLFEQQFDYGYDIKELRQTADGRVYLLIGNGQMGGEGSRRMAELNSATGLVTEYASVQVVTKSMDSQRLGVWGDKLATYKNQALLGNEVTVINVDDGSEACVLSFKGTSYVSPEGLSMQDFRVLEDESVEILWAARDGSKSLREKLRMQKVEKIPIVLRGVYTEGWLTAQINGFNRQSETYHVVVEDCGQGNDVEDFARLTSIQIVSGKGPDIIDSDLMKDYIPGMMEKGALEDLRPYMERNSIREEDYFPFIFGTWKDGDRICGINPASPTLAGYCIDSAVLGETKEPDIKMLVDVLLARDARQAGQENAAFLKGCDSQELLELFLKGSDTLWGMVDWEKGSCDFSGELFAQILEVAKRYGDSGDRGEVSYIAQSRSFWDIFDFDSKAEREKAGKVICGALFDDGCHAAVMSYSALAVNANSPNKEGAWEFISFLLGDEAQSASSGVPAARKSFDAWVEKQKERVAGGKEIRGMHAKQLADGSTVITGVTVYTEADITDEIVAEYRETLEDARPYSFRTIPILDIISGEAEYYFNGSKSVAEVGRTIANRVQTYLDEGR